MSTANKAKDTYLQHVSLKNYKSIKDAKIDFKPGLNIVIGKNASGKTNFINGLDKILNLKFKDLPVSEYEIEISINKEILTLGTTLSPENDNKILNYRKFKLNIDHKALELKNVDEVLKQIEKTKNIYRTNFVSYGIPYKDDTEFLQIPSSVTISSHGAILSENLNFNDSYTIFIRQYFSNLFQDIAVGYGPRKPLDKNYIDEKIRASNHIFKFLNSRLEFYSPISAIQINPDFRTEYNSFNNEIILTNFSFQFKVLDTWQPFNFLSDGTKRLFYIISEISGLNFIHERAVPENTNFDIILLEEPELGIHPHQVHQLMQFIKEQSKDKQIIITTHSPQVLDTLSPDELDRIVICQYDSNKGTQLSHLSDKEIKKAKKYMQEEAFLSDYWRFSDLEPAS